MEDRCSDGLYLEMAKTDPDAYAEARVDAVRARALMLAHPALIKRPVFDLGGRVPHPVSA